MPFDSETPIPDPSARAASRQLRLHVRMPDGGRLSPPASAGSRLVDLLTQFGLRLRTGHAAACACQACRVQIPLAWRDRLAPPLAKEQALLGQLDDRDASTRLLGFIVMTPELDGLELELHPDCLVPQTYWIAG